MQFPWHFRWKHLRSFYFRYQVHFLLSSFSLGLNSAAALKDVIEVLKSISSSSHLLYVVEGLGKNKWKSVKKFNLKKSS